MTSEPLQQTLFQQIKSLIPPHMSMVDEIAELLNISQDSAYRRIRGEKAINLEEIQKIARRYKVSLDQLLQLQNDSFIFSGALTDPNNIAYEKWLENVLNQMKFLQSFEQKHVYFLAKDLPFFQHFQIKELSAFKHFFWKKSILHNPDMRGNKFSLTDIDPVYVEMGNKIIDIYNTIPSTEIWNLECINSTIRQIEFYRESKVFKSQDDVQCLYDKIGDLINHMEHQAELGVKFNINSKPNSNAGSYTLFNNEIMLGDNTFHVVLNGRRMTFLNHSTLNFVMTRDELFTSHMQDVLDNLIRKSVQISSTGEKERSRFFNRLRDKIKLAARL